MGERFHDMNQSINQYLIQVIESAYSVRLGSLAEYADLERQQI